MLSISKIPEKIWEYLKLCHRFIEFEKRPDSMKRDILIKFGVPINLVRVIRHVGRTYSKVAIGHYLTSNVPIL